LKKQKQKNMERKRALNSTRYPNQIKKNPMKTLNQ
jgi:hypothetical protein